MPFLQIYIQAFIPMKNCLSSCALLVFAFLLASTQTVATEETAADAATIASAKASSTPVKEATIDDALVQGWLDVIYEQYYDSLGTPTVVTANSLV
jgi:uncharacterized iron-regulated protein